MNYPEELLRGIPKKDFIDEDNKPLASMFQFDECEKDKNLKASISWLDDEGALEVLSLQINREGNLQFAAGIAVMEKARLDMHITSMLASERLGYEREKLGDNIYHGNITMINGLSKSTKKMIIAQVASCVVNILPNKYADG